MAPERLATEYVTGDLDPQAIDSGPLISRTGVGLVTVRDAQSLHPRLAHLLRARTWTTPPVLAVGVQAIQLVVLDPLQPEGIFHSYKSTSDGVSGLLNAAVKVILLV